MTPRHLGTFNVGDRVTFDAYQGEVVTLTIVGIVTTPCRKTPRRKAWLDPYPGRRQ